MALLCLQKGKILAIIVQEFPVLCNQKLKGFIKKYMVQNVWAKIPGNLDFVANSNSNRESTEAAVRVCSSINSQENTRGEVLL